MANKIIKWYDKTKNNDNYFFYDQQTGKEFIDKGLTEKEYTFWRELNDNEKKLWN